MSLNTIAGRSFNDLTQYPVFPFIIKDYTSPELDITDASVYRNLSKAMGDQHPGRSNMFMEKYNVRTLPHNLLTLQTLLEMKQTPYLYGSHYSNIGTVLHFMVRLEPFSQYLIEFQGITLLIWLLNFVGGKFDLPDRIFHCIDTTWKLSSEISNADVKELIPEFYNLPIFLENSNDFDLGIRSNGERVGAIVLPEWAGGSARNFIIKHRQALESQFVSHQIPNWIDLIFGYKQVCDPTSRVFILHRTEKKL